MSNESKKLEVFVSYSHTDAVVVKPIVELQRATGSAVFRDAESIPPGKKWRAAIEDAIDACRLVWVFWCTHASESKEVRGEYEMGINLNKDVVPVLMDATPLPPELAEFQWIDMRRALGSHEEAWEVTVPISVPDQEKRQKTDGPGMSWDGEPSHSGSTVRGDEVVSVIATT